MRTLLFAALLVLAGCTCGDKLPDYDRSHVDEVRSDCKSWIKAWVRDPGKTVTISRLDDTKIPTIVKLQAELRKINVTGSLGHLRYKRIAERRGVEPLPESKVVHLFITAALEITNERRISNQRRRKEWGIRGGCDLPVDVPVRFQMGYSVGDLDRSIDGRSDSPGQHRSNK